MSSMLNVVSRNISSVSSVTFGGALKDMCINVYMCINTHSSLEIFSGGKFYFFIFLLFYKFQNKFSNITMLIKEG